MEGRWTVAMTVETQQLAMSVWPGVRITKSVPVVPCDDAAIERAVNAAIEFDADTTSPDRDWYRGLVEAALRAAGETS